MNASILTTLGGFPTVVVAIPGPQWLKHRLRQRTCSSCPLDASSFLRGGSEDLLEDIREILAPGAGPAEATLLPGHLAQPGDEHSGPRPPVSSGSGTSGPSDPSPNKKFVPPWRREDTDLGPQHCCFGQWPSPRASEGFPPPSLRGRCLKAIWRYITLSERVGSCVIGRVDPRSPCNGVPMAEGEEFHPVVRPPCLPAVLVSGPQDCLRPRPDVSPRLVPPTLVGRPSASGTGACCPPACGEMVPSAASGGSLGSLGAPCPPASAPPGRVPLCRGWPLRDQSEVTGVELFPPGVSSVVASQIMPMVKGKVR